jgi:hypothetical protein
MNHTRDLPYEYNRKRRRWSCLTHKKKYILVPKYLLTFVKALRQMFKSKEDPPLALEAESSNWRLWASGFMWNTPREQTSCKKSENRSYYSRSDSHQHLKTTKQFRCGLSKKSSFQLTVNGGGDRDRTSGLCIDMAECECEFLDSEIEDSSTDVEKRY